MGRRACRDDDRGEAVRSHPFTPFLPLLTPPSDARRPLKAQLQAELGAAASEDEREGISAAFASREKALEHDLDHKPMDVHMTLDLSYNFLSK